MNHYTVLYNPYSHKNNGLADTKTIEKLIPDGEFTYADATSITDFYSYISKLPSTEKVVITGGDGSLNFAVNGLYKKDLIHEVYYFPAGTGNDFMRDINVSKNSGPILLKPFLSHLPMVHVNQEDRYFVNAIGYGLDGYCCEEADRLHALGKERSYTMIAFLGLMWKYKPCGGTVTIDGKTAHYKKIWMAPTMFGRYFGGGVNMCPNQDRFNAEHMVSSVVIHDVSRLHAALLFLKVVNGQGPTKPQFIHYEQGYHVEVKFDRPISLQIDGETRLNITDYSVDADR